MGEIAISVEELSKRYRIGLPQDHHETFMGSLAAWAKSPIRNYRRLRKLSRFRNGEDAEDVIWALRDVSFQVGRGEVVGVIGRNGAGKSTLLKMLSRITEPSAGRAQINGRVASLLEVGTGFHPELTGRENVYLNGTILGMTKPEIDRKFDEIVEFSGVPRFIDTAVKRYSSGMQVRLAFAVAAHLDPEILLVDEVLAVGDAEFQKRCIGKMGEVARGGRTVLFISHNMSAVRSLCQRSLLLSEGRIAADGETDRVIADYLASSYQENGEAGSITWSEGDSAPRCDELRIRAIRLVDENRRIAAVFDSTRPIRVEIDYEVIEPLKGMRLVLLLKARDGVVVFASTDQGQRPGETRPGLYRSATAIPAGLLNEGRYIIDVHVGIPGVRVLIPGRDYLALTTVAAARRAGMTTAERWPGVVAPQLMWSVERFAEGHGICDAANS